MFKNKKVLMFASSLILGAITTGAAITTVSCTSSKQIIRNDAFKQYKDFVYGTHGRWAGNYANFIPKNETSRSMNIDKHTFGQYGLNKTNLSYAGYDIQNPKQDIKLTNPFDQSKNLTENDADGIGSHYAFEWLVNRIKSFGFKDLGGDYSVSGDSYNNPNYPNEVTVTIEPKTGKIEKLTDDSKTNQLVDTAEGNKDAVVIKKDDKPTKPFFQEQGFITQGYLWNGVDRITNKPVANQYEQNIVVTIKALNDDGTPKFIGYKTFDDVSLKDVKRNAFWITAHYDSTGTENINSKSWGATDNGTGVGSALDIVEFYSKSENAKKLPCDLNIAFVGGEEVGITGSTALVHQFLTGDGFDKINKAQIGGMLNIDTAAGGDNIYVHSPWTTLYQMVDNKLVPSEEKQLKTAALNTLIRDQLNAISKMQADSINNKNAVLQIHPFITPVPGADGYLQGQTGDWSDHASFYKLGLSNVAYIEATNFQIDGNSGYDGYSQTSNKAVWLYKKQEKQSDGTWKDCFNKDNKLITKQGNPIKSKLQGENIDVWGPSPNDFKEFVENNKTYRWARYNSGAIWHWDFDRPQFMEKEFGNRIQKQLTNIGATLRTFFTTMNISTFNDDLNTIDSIQTNKLTKSNNSIINDATNIFTNKTNIATINKNSSNLRVQSLKNKQL